MFIFIDTEKLLVKYNDDGVERWLLPHQVKNVTDSHDCALSATPSFNHTVGTLSAQDVNVLSLYNTRSVTSTSDGAVPANSSVSTVDRLSPETIIIPASDSRG